MILNIVIFIIGLVILGSSIYIIGNDEKMSLWRFAAGAAGIVLCILSTGFKIVPTGYTGVRTTFGQVSEQVVHKGFNSKIPLVQSIKLVNVKQQDICIKDEIWGETVDKTPVIASNVVVTYQINGERASWIYSNVSDYDDNLISSNIVSSSLKSSMIKFNAQDVTNRTKIEPSVRETLQSSLNEKYGNDTVKVVKVVINQMDFEKSYNDAIAKKSIAQQKQEEQKIANETAIAKAEADKKVAIANAEAKAESVRIAAEAESDANKTISNSLNDNVLQSKFYEKWNGKLPDVMGNNSVITDVSGK